MAPTPRRRRQRAPRLTQVATPPAAQPARSRAISAARARSCGAGASWCARRAVRSTSPARTS